MRMTSMIHHGALVLALLLPSASAQEKPAKSTEVFRSHTNLVLVPVQVKRKGEHVSGLTKDRFTLLQDGKPRTIAVFEEVRATPQRLEFASVGADEFTNQLTGDHGSVQFVVIAIDTINTPPIEVRRVRDELLKFLVHATDKGESIRLVSVDSRGLQILQDFTSDNRVLAATLLRAGATGKAGQVDDGSADLQQLENLFSTLIQGEEKDANAERLAQALDAVQKSRATMERGMAFQQQTSRTNSLEALQQVALSMAGLPGRKALIWASSGFPFSNLSSTSASSTVTEAGVSTGSTRNFGAVVSATALDAYTTHLLNSGNIAVYPIDARLTVNTAFASIEPSQKESPTYAQRQAIYEDNQDIAASFERLASATGGRACIQNSALSRCFETALNDSLEYYMLGFYLDSTGVKEGWHKLEAKVAEKGLNVRSRNGFLYPIPDAVATHDRDMGVALNSLLLDTGLPFTGRWETVQPTGEKRKVRYQLKVPVSGGLLNAENKMDVEFAVLARAQGGAVAGHSAQRVTRTLSSDAAAEAAKVGILYKHQLELAPGEYMVRFVVRDNGSGRLGSVNTRITVP